MLTRVHRRSTRVVTLAALAALAAAGCDMPTEAPRWNTDWTLPAKNTTIGVRDLLPAAVQLSPDGQSFVVTLAGVTVNRSIANLCSVCGQLPQIPVPKPAFQATIEDSVALPAGTTRVQVATGRVDVSLLNNFAFDPVRPGNGNYGSVVTQLYTADGVIAADTLKGAVAALPVGQTTVRSLTLSNVAINGPVHVRIILDSPSGSSYVIRTTDAITITARPQAFTIANAYVTVANQPITGESLTMDLDAFDGTLTDRVQGGTISLDITNPFSGVTGNLNVRIQAPNGAPITRTAALPLGSGTVTLNLTGPEFRSILGQKGVQFNVGGTVRSQTAVLVRPTDEVTVKARINVTVSTTKAQ